MRHLTLGDKPMLVIVSVSRLDNDRIEIRVARPQHDSNPAQAYPSESQVRAVLFGMSAEEVNSYLKLLAQMGANEQLTLPPMNIPQHELVSRISTYVWQNQSNLKRAASYPFGGRVGSRGSRLPVDAAWLLEGRRSERLKPAVSVGLVHWRLVRRVPSTSVSRARMPPSETQTMQEMPKHGRCQLSVFIVGVP
jgi:hypothetical protein